LQVESDGQRAVAHCTYEDSNIPVQLLKQDDGSWLGNIAHIPNVNTTSGPIALLTEQTATKELVDYSGFHLLSDKQLDVTFWTEMFSRLHSENPPYYSWVTRALRWLVLVDSGNQRKLVSSSHPNLPGLAYISNLPDFLSISEMLIHEASHQYFNAVTHLGDVADPSDARRYYSPFVNTMRPLDRIALAYHAFGNVFLFYRSYVDRSLSDRDIESRLSRTLADLKTVEGFLIDNPALTNLGLYLIEPLTTAIRDGT